MATKPKFVVDSDTKTLWVNGEVAALGRFSERSGEIFLPDGGTAAVHSPDALDQWEQWVSHMQIHHDITIPDRNMPAFVKLAKSKREN